MGEEGNLKEREKREKERQKERMEATKSTQQINTKLNKGRKTSLPK